MGEISCPNSDRVAIEDRNQMVLSDSWVIRILSIYFSQFALERLEGCHSFSDASLGFGVFICIADKLRDRNWEVRKNCGHLDLEAQKDEGNGKNEAKQTREIEGELELKAM